MSTYVKSVCVYCGSRYGQDPAFAKAAEQTGHMLVQNDWRLVYGAGDVGLMGRVANAVQDKGGATFGVIPTHLLDWEVGKLLSHIVDSGFADDDILSFVQHAADVPALEAQLQAALA